MVNEGQSRNGPTAGPSRSRRTLIAEEDATKLQFGDFANGEALTPTEVKTLLEAARMTPGAPSAPDNKVYKSASEYVKEFSNASVEVISQMRGELEAQGGFFNKFEMAQIMYLRPTSIDVAVALIPSLERYTLDDADRAKLEMLLESTRNTHRFGNGQV